MDVAVEKPVQVELSPSELNLVRAGLRMLLHAEDDPQAIEELKTLLMRLSAEGPAAAVLAVEHRRHRD